MDRGQLFELLGDCNAYTDPHSLVKVEGMTDKSLYDHCKESGFYRQEIKEIIKIHKKINPRMLVIEVALEIGNCSGIRSYILKKDKSGENFEVRDIVRIHNWAIGIFKDLKEILYELVCKNIVPFLMNNRTLVGSSEKQLLKQLDDLARMGNGLYMVFSGLLERKWHDSLSFRHSCSAIYRVKRRNFSFGRISATN